MNSINEEKDRLSEERRITVVIPCYNREKTIKRCIDSIVNQTVCPQEIIVVDDGSTDHTLSILKKNYGNKVTILKQQHKGAQAARNAGIRAAKGNYIAFLDSDDEWMPNKLELQIQELKKHPQAVICGDGYIQADWKREVPKIYKQGKRWEHGLKSRKAYRMNGKSGYVYRNLLSVSFCMFQALLVSRETLYKIGLLDEKVPSYQEWDTGIRLAKQAEFVYMKTPLFIYHLHDGVTISKNTQKDIDGYEYICKKYQYEILSWLGKNALIQRYEALLKKCKIHKDKRFFEYLCRYALSKMGLFIFR